jgi:anthranilate synthase component II
MAAWVPDAGAKEPYPIALTRWSYGGQNSHRRQGSKWSSSVANENSAVLLNFDFDIRRRGLSAKFIAAFRLNLTGAAQHRKRRLLWCAEARMQRVTLIDNYDSFTFNLVHYLGELGADVSVWRNDEITVADALADKPDAIVLSPGPCTPNEAGVCVDLVHAASETTPMLGVCLGHQAIGQAFGGDVVRAPTPMHGKVSRISHNARGLFRGLNGPFSATRYHSLVIERSSAPPELEVSAETDDGIIMGVQHRDRPIFGVQFHPESIASEHGRQILRNFLDLAEVFHQRQQTF